MIVLFEFKRLIKNNFISFLILLFVSLILLICSNIVLTNKDTIDTSLKYANQGLLDIFNINKTEFTTVNGFYAFYIKCISFISSFFAISLGIEIARRDKLNHTKDFLYTKPIKRSYIIIYRIIGTLIYILCFVLFVFIFSIIYFTIKKYNFDLKDLFLIDFSLFLLMSVFFSYGLVIGGFSHMKLYLLSLISIIPFLLTHIIGCFISFDLLYYVNPFSYFSFEKIITDGYQYSSLIITIFLQVFLMNFGINIYENNLTENKDNIED